MAWAISIAVFVVLFFVLMLVFGGFLAFLIAGAAVFCLFFFYLDKRAIGIECPSCGKYILTNTPWICGFCGAKNFCVDEYPFVGRCGNKECGAEPKAYQCHHCEKLVFLTPDRQRFNFAKCVNVPVRSKPVQTDPHEGEIAKKKRELELTELSVKKAKFDVELKGYKDTLETPKIKTVGERLRGRVHSKTELDDEVRRLKAEADKEFADDKDEREKRYRQIEEEARELL